MTFTTINGSAVHYEYLKGNRETTFLFINSLGTDFRIWDGVVGVLQKYGSCLRFDKPGHGLSELPSGDCGIADYALCVINLMDELHIQKAVVVGLSIGGVIGQYLAIHYADRVEKLVLSNTGPKIGTADSWNVRIEKVRGEGIGSIADALMGVWFSKHFHQVRQQELSAYKTMLSQSPLLGYIAACEALRENDLRDAIVGIGVPTLCFAGSEDGSTPPALVKAMADAIPHAKYVLIEGVGHIPCVEQPEVVAKHIIEFAIHPSHSLYTRGMATRRAVLGDAHVDRAEANKTDLDKDFQRYITESAWGAVWSRPHLTRRERSMLTIAILAALGHEEEVAMHIKATKNTGATIEDIKEVLLHLGVYAGVPSSNMAYKIAKKVYSEMEN